VKGKERTPSVGVIEGVVRVRAGSTPALASAASRGRFILTFHLPVTPALSEPSRPNQLLLPSPRLLLDRKPLLLLLNSPVPRPPPLRLTTPARAQQGQETKTDWSSSRELALAPSSSDGIEQTQRCFDVACWRGQTLASVSSDGRGRKEIDMRASKYVLILNRDGVV
jgi:hypothetical protein